MTGKVDDIHNTSQNKECILECNRISEGERDRESEKEIWKRNIKKQTIMCVRERELC